VAAAVAVPTRALAVRGAAVIDPALRSAPNRDAAVAVIVQGGAVPELRAAVARAHGTITRELPIIDGVAARVPRAALVDIAAVPGVRAISLDSPVHVASSGTSTTTGPRNVYDQEIGATALRKSTGVDGRNVTVALIDTGVNEVPDLARRILPVTDDQTGETTPCLNLSGEADCTDSYGHGTFIAGLIAGDGTSSSKAVRGVAPRANLVSVKIAGADGSADVSTVLAAIQWVVSFRDRYNIRVLNLSLGTDSNQSYKVDPLDYAVERAWASGVVVVVAASNRGPDAGTISKPGDDPFVITVGAVDDKATTDVTDDVLPHFTGRGPTASDGLAKPDVVAPGAHVISLNAEGSSIANNFPTDIADYGGAYRRGSGTSMATGIVSGSVALLIQRDPTITPDRVKYVLAATTVGVASTDPMAVGDGLIDVNAAATFTAPGEANQGLEHSTGMGSLGASRAGVGMIVSDPSRTILSGLSGAQETAQLATWDPYGFVTGDWSGTSWYGSSWYGRAWFGSSWYSNNWEGKSWAGSSWYGTVDGSSWYGSSWYGSSWYGAWG
jgi:serine protease AprX